jgi:hypothetical protein
MVTLKLSEELELFDLLSAPALREFRFGDKTHPIGTITPLHVRLIAERGSRIDGGTATKDDQNPLWCLIMLLHQGNPNIDFSSIARDISPKHIEAAIFEVRRQIAVGAFGGVAVARTAGHA